MELEVSLGTGTGTAGCSGCGRVFTSVSAFDKHQRIRDGLVCLDPASVGLELKPNGRWGGKGDPGLAAKLARAAVTASPGAPDGPRAV